MLEVDFVVVGSGSAGAAVAARLSEDPEARVLLLEAGPPDRSPIFHIPAAARYAFNAVRYNWNYESEPEPHLDGRRLKQPRGRVLGGSSSINGLVYLRGNPLDYEGWAAGGAAGWSYAEVAPYFRKLEGWALGPEGPGPADGRKGLDGPVRISTPEPLNPIAAAFIEAGREAGYPLTDDVNGRQQEGFGRFPMNAAGGIRSSTANAYIKPARRRANLTIWSGALAERIGFEGRRAATVQVRVGGRSRVVRARREIVLCCGSINTPHLLMLSGVGPGDQLRRFGLPVVQDLPGVGENLQDHPIATLQFWSKAPVSLAAHLGLGGAARGLADWLLRRRGVLASNHFEAGAFIRSAAGVAFPDLQLYLFPVAVDIGANDFHRRHGFQIQISSQRSQSRGWVRLRSADPRDPPRFLVNMMAAPDDWVEMRAALRLAREVVAQPAMDFCRDAEFSPGPGVATDAEIDAFLRRCVQSSYHPSGTCKMGVDPMAVVDPRCRVHGVDGLRVADSSIMPVIASCNLNAPSMMIGEKTAAMIRGRELPPEPLDWFQDRQWRSRQRPGQPVRPLDASAARPGVDAPST